MKYSLNSQKLMPINVKETTVQCFIEVFAIVNHNLSVCHRVLCERLFVI